MLSSFINIIKSQLMKEENVNIKVIGGGPLIVLNSVCITHADGTEEIKENRASFCRCGASENMPYCDGKHKALDFDK